MEDFEFASVVGGGASDVPVPVVGDAGDHGEGKLLAGATDEDGRVGLLEGLGLEGGVAEVVVASFEVGAVLGPEEAYDADGLFESADAFGIAGEVDVVGVVFGTVPACADAEDDASVAGVVYGGDGFGEGDGMSEGSAGDEGADAGAVDHLGEGGEEAPGVGNVAVLQFGACWEVVVVDPEVVEAELFQFEPGVSEQGPCGLLLAGLDAESDFGHGGASG